jgi:hypothetical protein
MDKDFHGLLCVFVSGAAFLVRCTTLTNVLEVDFRPYIATGLDGCNSVARFSLKEVTLTSA